MSLFQKSVEKKYLNELDQALIDKKFAEFKAYFGNTERQENIRNSKEEQFQEGFLRELFVKILGYTLNPEPNFNLISEQKNVTDSRKADGAILKNDKVIAVIELKSTHTIDLKSVERQAFGYKNYHQKCVYVITSNFEKLRFYIQNAVNHLEFDLFKLTREEFALMWLCLAQENLLNDLPLKIKENSLEQEENVTKQLYSDYSKFREDLFHNLVKNNPDIDRLTLFKKTQKLIDRFLFIFFAEDKQLLPANSINQIIEKWEDDLDFGDVKPLYLIFKKYFHILNIGRPKSEKRQEIFAYNGGLFLTDEILDNAKIDDSILKEYTHKLSSYDFDTEVDVNILGHIFEHSLGEIENVQAEINGEKVDARKAKRKKDGIFYTPKYITKYIVENTVGKLCKEKRNELGILDEEYAKGRKNRRKETIKELDDKLKIFQEWLLSLTILDPACGSGAFLNQALEFLIEKHREIDELRAQLLGGAIVFSDISTDILEKNIYGVDINEESVEIAKLSLWLRTARKGRKLNTLTNNIKCGNSLIDDPENAFEKSFNWQKEFPEIFAKGGFDVVIGNPPYVRAELLGFCRDYLANNYDVFNPSGDLFFYFYEKSFKLLKPKGFFGFISNTFDKTTAGITVREYLQNEIVLLKYVDFTEVQIFEGATTYPVIIIAKNNKQANQSFEYIKIPKSSQSDTIDIDFHESVSVNQSSLDKENWSFKSNSAVKLINKLQKNQTIKDLYGKSYRGILTGLNEAFIIPKSYPIDEHVKPIYEGKDLEKWTSPESYQQVILFESKWTKKTYGESITEDEAIEKIRVEFPKLINQIEKLEERAKSRFDKGDFFWELRNCAYYDLFEKPKIVFPNLQNSNKFAFDESGTYINAPAVILPTEDKFLVAILNSKLVWYFLSNICVVRSGGYIEVKPQYFEQIPIPSISENIKDQLTNLTNELILKTSENKSIQTKFIKLLSSNFTELKLTRKIRDWFCLNYVEFKKELAKQKINFSLSQESEWIEYFEEQKNKYSSISTAIFNLENKVDEIVNSLYSVTELEIEVIKEFK